MSLTTVSTSTTNTYGIYKPLMGTIEGINLHSENNALAVTMHVDIPSIKTVIINDPAVIVMWDDDSKTIGKAMSGTDFSPEIGLAMAISKKYFKLVGSSFPRGSFKQALKHATNYSDKTKSKKQSE